MKTVCAVLFTLLFVSFSHAQLSWQRTYGGAGIEYGLSVMQTSDGGYVVAGQTDAFGNAIQGYLIKTDSLGDTLWTRTYGGGGFEEGKSVRQTSDGGYIVAGWNPASGVQAWLVKTDSLGDTLWTRAYGGTDYDYAESVQQTLDGGYVFAGWTRSFGNDFQVYLVKTDASGNLGVQSSPPHAVRLSPYAVYPNPFVSYASIPGHASERFALYDVMGRKMGSYPGARIGEGLAAGVYFLKPEGKDAKPLRIVKLR